MLTVIAFLSFNCIGYMLAILRGPFWCLLVYANIYFNSPNPAINWWAAKLPFHRWSLLTIVVLIFSLFVHKKKLSPRKLKNLNWAVAFLALSAAISMTIAVNKQDALKHSYMLLTYLITCYCIIRSIKNEILYRYFVLITIFLTTNLSISLEVYPSYPNG